MMGIYDVRDGRCGRGTVAFCLTQLFLTEDLLNIVGVVYMAREACSDTGPSAVFSKMSILKDEALLNPKAPAYNYCFAMCISSVYLEPMGLFIGRNFPFTQNQFWVKY